MRGAVRGGCGVLGLGSVWHQLFEDEGEAKLLSFVGQCCRGGPCCPESSVGRLKIRVSAGRDTPLHGPAAPPELGCSEGAQHRGDSPW